MPKEKPEGTLFKSIIGPNLPHTRDDLRDTKGQLAILAILAYRNARSSFRPI